MLHRSFTRSLALLALSAAMSAAQPDESASQTPANTLTRQRDVVVVNGGAAAGQWSRSR